MKRALMVIGVLALAVPPIWACSSSQRGPASPADGGGSQSDDSGDASWGTCVPGRPSTDPPELCPPCADGSVCVIQVERGEAGGSYDVPVCAPLATIAADGGSCAAWDCPCLEQTHSYFYICVCACVDAGLGYLTCWPS